MVSASGAQRGHTRSAVKLRRTRAASPAALHTYPLPSCIESICINYLNDDAEGGLGLRIDGPRRRITQRDCGCGQRMRNAASADASARKYKNVRKWPGVGDFDRIRRGECVARGAPASETEAGRQSEGLFDFSGGGASLRRGRESGGPVAVPPHSPPTGPSLS